MTRRLWSVVAAAAAIAGALVVVVPQHAASLAALAAGTVVVVVAVFLLVLAGPLVTAERPRTALDTPPGVGAATLDPQGLRDARRDLAARRGHPVPPAVHARLHVAAELALQRLGLEVDDPRAQPQVDALLDSGTRALLTTPPVPSQVVDPARTAATVHRTLDEFDRLVAPTGGPHDHHR